MVTSTFENAVKEQEAETAAAQVKARAAFIAALWSQKITGAPLLALADKAGIAQAEALDLAKQVETLKTAIPLAAALAEKQATRDKATQAMNELFQSRPAKVKALDLLESDARAAHGAATREWNDAQAAANQLLAAVGKGLLPAGQLPQAVRDFADACRRQDERINASTALSLARRDASEAQGSLQSFEAEISLNRREPTPAANSELGRRKLAVKSAEEALEAAENRVKKVSKN